MDIEEYEPISTLVVKENIITKAKYPFIDVHNHQFDMPLKDLSKLIEEGINNNIVVAIGEAGLDYDRLQFCEKEQQLKGFIKQIL